MKKSKKIVGFILGIILALNVMMCNFLYCFATDDNITVLENFYSSVSIVKDNADFQSLFKQFKSVVKANVQKWNSSVSDEMYEAWSDEEATEYYFLYICPRIEIETNSQIISKSRLIDSLNSFKDVILNYEDGEIYYKALVKGWEWIWDKYEQTAKVPDLFAGVDLQNFETMKSVDENSNKRSTEVSEELESSVTESIIGESMSEASNVDISQADRSEEKQNLWVQILDVLKNNIFTLIVLVGVGIAIIIIRRKNKDKITNDKI